MDAGPVVSAVSPVPARAGSGRMAVLLAFAAALSLSSCQAPAPGAEAPGSPPGTVLASHLQAPWSMVPLADGTLLVSERGSARLVAVAPDGRSRTVGQVDGVVPQGEGGLLGLAVGPDPCAGAETAAPESACQLIYAYFTAAEGNTIVRMELSGTGENMVLGAATVLVAGIPKAGTHNGGRIAFGPDGMLYATTGDAGHREAAQDPDSLAGKILRLRADGTIPGDNPFPGSPVWTLGHRNPQGIAWDGQGRMWASEFGQNTWDELNRIQRGGNYGWPVVEGKGADRRFQDPVLQWTTGEASPSGIAIDGTTLYMAALRGEKLWRISLSGEPQAQVLVDRALGRLRDVAVVSGGRVLVLTNNTDGRGTPAAGDDKIVQLQR
ncbi:PQQ-dependent sugar dehydrogenase [Specibacter sp. NPDC057265]|uniref:PQQ-dependent sugar dehydrogenase n=1 Tax=Specibacter sp. NPDC057265 TaxID=3346075 RepID=UPI00363A0D17